MEQKEFKFDEATSLQAFIDKYRDRVVGHTLKAVYADNPFYTKSHGLSGPVYLILDDLCIGIEFLYPSHMTVFTADENDFSFTGEPEEEDEDEYEYKSLKFYSKIPGRDDDWLSWNKEAPGMNQKVKDIKIERFSYQHEEYPNSLRPAGGDYFRWLRFVLEDGTVLNIDSEPAEMDGYVEMWLTDLPAYKLVKAELDRDPSDIGIRINNQFDGLMSAWNAEPDELAELAMYYMRKCDHEIENYGVRKEIDWLNGRNVLYTDHLRDIMRYFSSMNIDYVDSSGKALKDLALEIGEEASGRVLPFLYTDERLKSYLDWLERVISSELETCQLRHRNGFEELDEAYNQLPDKVKKTAYGKKLKDIRKNGLWELEMYYKAILEYIRPLH